MYSMKFGCLLVLLCGFICSGVSQEQEFINVVKEFLEGDQLDAVQNMYSSLPIEVRDKLTKNLLSNPGKVGKDLLNMFGPQVQNLINAFAPKQKQRKEETNEVEVDEMSMDYSKQGQHKRPSDQLDFGPLGSMLGNLISSNPQALINLIQGFTQGGSKGFSFENLTEMLTQQFDLDTLINMASTFASGANGPGKKQGITELLQLQQITQMWTDFATSPIGQKVNRIMPRLLKAEGLPEALRIVERETAFRFDVLLLQLQEPSIRKMLVHQMVRPIGQFFRGIQVPSDLKTVIARTDEVLNNKMGLGPTIREYVDPVTQYIRETFKITKDSLLELSPEDIEKIASDILNKEVLTPLSYVYDAYLKAKDNTICAKFVFCQLNRNFYNENFIRRHVIKTASIISAFQASAIMKKDAFSGLYDSILTGSDGFDCTHGQSNFCLDLMHTTAHNEL